MKEGQQKGFKHHRGNKSEEGEENEIKLTAEMWREASDEER